MFPATDPAATISFNQLHGECQTRIQQKQWCPHHEREVPNSEIVKGYEFEKGRYVVMTEEDIAKVRPETTRMINLVQFAEIESLDPIYFERPYYLAPDGRRSRRRLRGGARGDGREGRHRQAGALRPRVPGRGQARESGLVMYTLRQADEIRAMNEVADTSCCRRPSRPRKSSSRKQVIATFESELDLQQLSRRLSGEGC